MIAARFGYLCRKALQPSRLVCRGAMKRDAAVDAANSWYELAGQAVESYGLLSSCLATCLPDDTDAVAAVFVQDQAAVVALAGDGLFVVTLESGGGAIAQPVVERFPLDSRKVTLRIRDDREGSVPAALNPSQDADARAYVREWVLTFPCSRQVSFKSVLRVAGHLHAGPGAGERFGRVLSERVGWTLPD